MNSAPCLRSAPERRARLALLLFGALIACEARPPEPRPRPAVPSSAAAATAPATAAPRAAPGFEEAAGLSYLLEHHGGTSPSDRLPLVVAIHGLGDRPEHFGILRDWGARARVVLPRGIDAYEGGWSWFEILGRDRQAEEVATGIARGADLLAALLAELPRRHPTSGKPIVTGFSQGGILSFALAVRHPEVVSLALPLGGYLPRSLWPRGAASASIPVVALHGAADPLLRIEPTRDTVGALRGAGYPIELIEYPGVGHVVSRTMRDELVARLERAIGEPVQR